MNRFWRHADDILRAEAWTVSDGSTRRLLHLALIMGVFGMFYGAVMGGYGASTGRWTVQPLISGLKVPILLVGTFAVALPSFLVINTLLGLRDEFRQVLRALMATQAGVTIILAALAPLTLLWYASTENYNGSILFNAGMFGLASVSAQLLLTKAYRPLVRINPRHRKAMWIWLVMYAFIGIQMGWVLRPFIGDPELPVRLLRPSAWGNAYVEVADTIWKVIAGG